MEIIVLASGSPRRKELLAKTGLKFSVVVSGGEEKAETSDPAETVEKLSLDKASAVADLLQAEKEPQLIIGADTVVACDGEILGKPSDREDAFRMLWKLQGQTHQVYTGVAMLVYGEDGEAKEICHAERTEVFVHEMSDEEIRNYIASGEPMDKAGAYGIQGKAAAFIEKIEGDYNNVVGLPVGRLYQEVKAIADVDLRTL